MKIIYLGCLIASLGLILSCKGETFEKINDAKNQISNTGKVVSNLSNMEESAKHVESRMEELKNIKPITSDEFKNWMPESLKDLVRNSYKFNTALGATGNLNFSNEDKSVEISIMDGAGEMGSALYASQNMFGAMYGGFESESDSKIESMEERDGISTIETYFKHENRSLIRFTAEERFIVNAEGENMSTDELYDYIRVLDIKKLN